MDPLKALSDLDNVCQNIQMSRADHAHLIRCVATIKEALAAKSAVPPSE